MRVALLIAGIWWPCLEYKRRYGCDLRQSSIVTCIPKAVVDLQQSLIVTWITKAVMESVTRARVTWISKAGLQKRLGTLQFDSQNPFEQRAFQASLDQWSYDSYTHLLFDHHNVFLGCFQYCVRAVIARTLRNDSIASMRRRPAPI